MGLRRADQSRESRRLAEGEVPQVFAEQGPGPLGDAVDGERAPVAEIDLVQIQLEDAGLGQTPLQQEGQSLLAELAPDRLLGAQQSVLDELLGQGARPDQIGPVAGQVGHRGPGDADRVDAGVGEESMVFGRQHRPHHVAGYLRQRHGPAPPPVAAVQGRQMRRVEDEALGAPARRHFDLVHVPGTVPGRREPEPGDSALLRPLAGNEGQRVGDDRVLAGPSRLVAARVAQFVEPRRQSRAVETQAGPQIERRPEHHRRRRRQPRLKPRVELPRQRVMGQQSRRGAQQRERESGLSVPQPRRRPGRPLPAARGRALPPRPRRAGTVHAFYIGSSRGGNTAGPNRRAAADRPKHDEAGRGDVRVPAEPMTAILRAGTVDALPRQ